MSITSSLLHLWAGPPARIQLACPAAPDGQAANLVGYFDTASVHAAFGTVALWSSVSVLVVIGACYLATSRSSGPSFDRRWWIALVMAVVLCGVLPYALLSTAHTTAMAQSCETNPSPFAAALPSGLVIGRSIAGLVWGALAFALGSVLFTQTIGRAPALRNGFFHNRGTPWPRMTPWVR